MKGANEGWGEWTNVLTNGSKSCFTSPRWLWHTGLCERFSKPSRIRKPVQNPLSSYCIGWSPVWGSSWWWSPALSSRPLLDKGSSCARSAKPSGRMIIETLIKKKKYLKSCCRLPCCVFPTGCQVVSSTIPGGKSRVNNCVRKNKQPWTDLYQQKVQAWCPWFIQDVCTGEEWHCNGGY